MIESANGLILRTHPLTETSLIVRWLTPKLGRVSTAAKGARRPKSPFRGKLDLFYEADFSFSRSRHSELHALREVVLREMHAGLRQDIECVRQASYCAALIEQVTEIETPLPAIYELMRVFLNVLPQRGPQPRNVFAFELKLLNELGLKPDTLKSRLSIETKKVVEILIAGDWTSIAELKPTASQAAELRRFLHGYLIYHLGKIPKQRGAAISSPVSRGTEKRLDNPAN